MRIGKSKIGSHVAQYLILYESAYHLLLEVVIKHAGELRAQ